jgi:hypothetical protein
VGLRDEFVIMQVHVSSLFQHPIAQLDPCSFRPFWKTLQVVACNLIVIPTNQEFMYAPPVTLLK